MEASAVLEALTPEQVAALRLVRESRSSKEIARQLGISKSAVDQRLDRARLVLGAATRGEAARIHARLEAACDRITCDPPAVDFAFGSSSFGSSPATRGTAGTSRTLREERATFDALDAQSLGPWRLTIALAGRLIEELSGPNWLRGVAWTALLAIGIIAIGIGLIATLTATLQTLLG